MTKIYNILVITTIYLTIIIATFSIFQYLKITELNELKREIEKNKHKLDDKLTTEIDIIEKKNNRLQNDTINLVSKYTHLLEEKSEQIDYKILQLIIELNLIKKDKVKGTGYIRKKRIIHLLTEVIEIAEKHDGILDATRFSATYNNLGVMYWQDDYNKSKECYLKALKYQDIQFERAVIYVNLGCLEYENKQFESSIEFFKKSIRTNESKLKPYIEIMKSFNAIHTSSALEEGFNYLKAAINRFPEKSIEPIKKAISDNSINNIYIKYAAKIDKILGLKHYEEVAIDVCINDSNTESLK